MSERVLFVDDEPNVLEKQYLDAKKNIIAGKLD